MLAGASFALISLGNHTPVMRPSASYVSEVSRPAASVLAVGTARAGSMALVLSWQSFDDTVTVEQSAPGVTWVMVVLLVGSPPLDGV